MDHNAKAPSFITLHKRFFVPLSVGGGRYPHSLSEDPGKVALITETQKRCDLRDGAVGGNEQLPGGLDPLMDQILAHGLTGQGPEEAAQMVWADSCRMGDIFRPDLLGQMVRQIVPGLFYMYISRVLPSGFIDHLAEAESRFAEAGDGC